MTTTAANNNDNNELTPPPANVGAAAVVNNEGQEQEVEPLPPAPPSIALHHVNSTTSRTTSVGTASSGGVASGTAGAASSTAGVAAVAGGGGGNGGALQTTPVLSGENIVLLSLSNHNTPNNYSHSSNASSSELAARERERESNNNWNDGFDEVERGVMMAALEEQEVTPTAGTLRVARSSTAAAESHVNKTTTAAATKPAYSPPPDSIHSEQLQSLSPPPLSLQHHDGNNSSPHGCGGGGSASIGGGGGGGSQSLFSGNNGSTPIMIAVAPSSSISHASNNNNNNNNGKQQKQRPPLPPRWAIGPHPMANANAPPINNNNNAPPMNITQQHPLPPKQIGPLSHRRVLSTGDASLMSVLTDPDSESSPLPSTTIISTTVTTTTANTGATGQQQQQQQPSSTTSSNPSRPPVINRKRGVSWDPSHQVQHQNSTTAQFFGQTAVGQQVELDTLGILQPILIDNDGGDQGEDGGMNNNNNNNDDWMEGLMQPVLNYDNNDDDGREASKAVMRMEQQQQQQQQQQQEMMQPPLPPEHILPLKTSLQPKSPKSSNNKSSSSNNNTNTINTPSRRQQLTSTTKSLRSSRKFGTSMTQFEDEANAAIMEALQSYQSMEQSKIVGVDDVNGGGDDGGDDLKGEQQGQQMSIPALGNNDEGVGREEDNGGTTTTTTTTDVGIPVPHHVVRPTPTHRQDVSGITLSDGLRTTTTTTTDAGIPVPHHVVRPTPTHRQDVSGITLSDGLDRSPRPPPASGLVTATFEDSAWHDGYDTAGRIDGTLVEERESQYIEEELGINLNAGSKISAAMNSVGGVVKGAVGDVLSSSLGQHKQTPSSPSPSSSSVVPGSDKESERSHGSKMSNASKASRKSGDQAAPPTGLRHRRSGTRGAGVLSAAQELAAMATIDESHEMLESNKGNSSHSHSKIPSDGHGIDNLLAGATLLFEQEEKLRGRRGSENESMPLIEEENSYDVIELDDPLPHDEETGEANNTNNNAAGGKRSPTANLFGRSRRERRREEQRFQLKMWYDDLIAPRLPIFFKAARHSIMFVMIPLLFLAIVLYYGFSNPLTGGVPERRQDLIDRKEFQGSWSWWVLFLLRQFFILSCVKAGEIISIDIIALRTPIFVRVFGSFATLTFVQARGWPYVLTFWGVFDLLVLYGNNAFAKHWLFWQDLIGMCNQQNPPAAFLHGRVYTGILFSMIFVGAATSLKRLVIATFLGRRSFAHYGPELETILAKMILVSQVAHLARRIEAKVTSVNIGSLLASGYVYTMKTANFGDIMSDSEADSSPSGSPRQAMRKSVDDSSDSSPQGFGESLRKSVYGKKLISGISRKNIGMLESLTKGASTSKMEIMKFLEEWEEPDLKANADSKASVKDILQFRQAISLMSDTYPFTQSFGPASTRAICVESANNLFRSLVSKTPHFGQRLPFETLSELAQDKDGELLRDKVKALVRLFRPDRKGFLTNVDFIRSIDSVYRELRLFRTNLSNSQQIDDSFHGLINILHYFIVTLIVLIIMGFNNWESLLSMTTFFFSFSFMFGPASSKYFEGILLIFVRRPYDIGDKVAISPPDQDTSASGSSTWFVEKVSLYTTTVRFATTNEVATYSNGSLARLRIINAKRSPKAIVYVYNKFGSDVPFSKIQVFKAAVENFVKARPREWSAFNGFRATRVEMELNFIEYVIVVTHRELWQNAGPILQSKADLASFSLEVSKRLGLRYEQPPKPIHLALIGRDVDNGGIDERSFVDDSSSGLQQVRDMFKKEE